MNKVIFSIILLLCPLFSSAMSPYTQRMAHDLKKDNESKTAAAASSSSAPAFDIKEFKYVGPASMT